MTDAAYKARVPVHAIDVVASGRGRRARSTFDLGENFTCSTAALESYAFAQWEPVIYDAMIVAASVEYADRGFPRPKLGWRRDFTVRVPVLEPEQWMDCAVYDALQDAASFLTGDDWAFEFIQRDGETPHPPQDCLQFSITTDAVIAFSDGMDSRAVAGLTAQALGRKLVRVRIGSKAGGRPEPGEPLPFAAVPYNVSASGETSARSRGFKFALISGIAAYLAEASEIILPESGQGIFGPALVTSSAQAYPDYRSHPLFTKRMERFLTALLKRRIRFVFPRIWSTKGETLQAYASLSGSDDWRETRSCWQNARHCSLNGELIQCGVCAACMLRRMSIHAAGLTDDDNAYACRDLHAETFEDSMQPGFRMRGRALREYAIAGAQHLDHLADLVLPLHRSVLRRHAVLVGPALDMSATVVETALAAVLERHAAEWNDFLQDKGARSFLRQWTRV
ncbi:7-cyano-7-deazaguanine synthase [Mesorhizobium sp. M0482]|uniref:7-cyano-7-deazaguanine synthase n=1 Tax=unclassified Mesorhizobium TaxID=325217 RepID=UPI00333B3B65